jgi:hypothetical protein
VHSPGAPAPALILIRRLEANVEVISQAMLNQVRREFVEHGDVLDIETQMATVRAIADCFLATARDNRPLSARERGRFAAIGAAAAGLGVDQPTMLAGIRLAGRIAWLYAAEEARELQPESLAVSALQQLGLLLFNYITEVCDLMTEGYAEDRLAKDSAAHAAVAVELIRGSLLAPDQLLSRAADAGYPTGSLWGTLVIFGASNAKNGETIREAAHRGLAQMPGGARADMLGGSVPHAVLLAPVATRAHWEGIVDRVGRAIEPLPARLLSGPAAVGLMAVPKAYREMRSLLRIASRLPVESNVQWESSLAVYHLLDEVGEEEREHLVAAVLGPVLALPAARRDVLLQTLDVVESRGGRAPAAAEALGLHPKTVTYRVSRAYELAGLNPRVPGDRFRVQLALHALRLSAATNPGAQLYPPSP